MKSHRNENLLPACPRFHVPNGEGLFKPIHFAFVSERMRDEIIEERDAILAALPPSAVGRQERLFARYDPQDSLQSFSTLLRLIGVS